MLSLLTLVSDEEVNVVGVARVDCYLNNMTFGQIDAPSPTASPRSLSLLPTSRQILRQIPISDGRVPIAYATSRCTGRYAIRDLDQIGRKVEQRQIDSLAFIC